MSSAVASSSTLWAQASKEWVIPAKPKPGRKPKKDNTAPPADEIAEVDSKGRRVQNRAAQRAFRERKQSQLADLQARVQLYEQGEMERNVALQNIAKRLKEENESLRKDNNALREELKRQQRSERSSSVETERKRWREDSLAPYSQADSSLRKRFKSTSSIPELSPESISSNSLSLVPSPASMASSPGSDSTSSSVQNDPYSPMSFPARSPNSQSYPQQQQAMTTLFSGFSNKPPACMNEGRPVPSFDQSFDIVDCGFCSPDTPCMCRELALQHVAARIAVHNEVPGTGPTIPTSSSTAGPMNSQSPPEVKMESRRSLSVNSTPQMTPAPAPVAPMSSILDNLPAYSPPVPLPRRRPADQPPPPPIFPVYPAESITSRTLRQNRSESLACTGDPSNCFACADDPFGKAFCAALGGSVKACSSCPNSDSAFDPGFVGCGGCGNPELCGGAGSNLNSNRSQPSSAPGTESNASASSPNHLSSTSNQGMPCNAAWAQLKSHPNIAFADLTLLAEVVARRSKCTGPRMILTPNPDLETRRNMVNRGSDEMHVLLTDPHAQYHDRPIPTPPRVMIQCGQQRVTEVNAEGVRDALALLDGEFQRS